MPPNVGSSVKTRFPLPIPDCSKMDLGGVFPKPHVCRRIFVQTDTGSVLGIELDQTDNVQTVKKKMQTMLNVPAEQSSLVLGSTVLKSDLSEVRNDSPLLLTRELQRSQSTPCFFQTSDAQELMDYGRPFELVGGLKCCSKMKRIMNDVVKALECGVEPLVVSGGLGGAYYFRNCRGDSVAVIKPTDEEPFAPNNPKGFTGKTLGQPGLKRAVRVGETGVREVAAYLLDHDHFAGVPSTVLVKVSHPIFHINSNTSVHRDHGKPCSPVSKLASCQEFVPHDYDASDHGTSRFSVSSVHRIGILDVRIFNTDRHAGNILVRRGASNECQTAWGRTNIHVNEILELIPIDHGLSLPEGLEDPYFEWLHWPQSSVPFSEEELEYIAKLDEFKDAEMLRSELPMLREACHRMLILSTTLLKKAAVAGYCLAEIGDIMSKDAIEESSQFEFICMQAKRALMSSSSIDDALSELSLEEVDDELSDQFEMDEEDCTEEEDRFEDGMFEGVPILTLPKEHRSWRQERQALSPLDEDGLLSVKKAVEPIGPSVGKSSYWGKKLAESPRSMWPSSGQIAGSPRMKQLISERLVNAKTSTSSTNVELPASRHLSYRSFSLNHQKQRYRNYDDRKKGYFKDVPLTPGPKMSAKTFSDGNTNQFLLADMSDGEWTCFLSCFKEILDEMLASRSNQNMNFRQRLGTSCQF